MSAELFWERLRAKVEEGTASFDGTVGLFIKDLTSGFEITVNPDAVFAIGSSIKIPILMTLHRAAGEGRLSLDAPVTVRPEDKTPGSGVLQHLDNPVTLTVRDVANLMILLSDNTATNLCIDLAGMESVNGLLKAAGFTHTRLRRKMIDQEAAAAGRENTSTPREAARLMELLYEGAGMAPGTGAGTGAGTGTGAGAGAGGGLAGILDAAACREVLAVLKKPKEGVIRRLLPPEIPVIHKTGGLEGVRADVGIVLVPGRPYIFAGMTNYCVRDADDSMLAEVSRVVFDYLRVLSRSTSAGRMLPEKYLRR